MGKLADEWTPGEKVTVFKTGEGQEEAQGSSDYFLDSADRIHFFTEEGVVDEEGALLPGIKKIDALNKVGHGLHVTDEVCAAMPSMQAARTPRNGPDTISHYASPFVDD